MTALPVAAGPAGPSLKVRLRRAERARQWRAFALIGPLLLFLAFTFLIPLAGMLWRSVDDWEVPRVLPRTAAAIGGWDGAGLPAEPVYAALAEDLMQAYRERSTAVAAKRLNYAQQGFRTLLMSTARQLKAMPPEGGARDALAAIDPAKDVEWRQYPADLLGLAVEKREIQALADGDPLVWRHTKNPQMVEITNNVCGEFATRTCCLVGLRGSLLRDNRPAAKALTTALIEAQHAAYADLRAAAAAYAPFAPKFPVEELEAMLRSHAHNVTPTGDELRQQLALYTDELKSVSVIKRSTDSQRFAGRITVDLA